MHFPSVFLLICTIQFNSLAVRYFSTLKKICSRIKQQQHYKKVNFHFKCCNNFCHSLTIIKDWPFFLISLSLSFYWPTGFFFAVVVFYTPLFGHFLHFMHFVFSFCCCIYNSHQQYYRRQWLTNLHLFQE